MNIENKIPFLEQLSEQWKEYTGADHQAYKNHVYRVIFFCFAMQNLTQQQKEKIIIAGWFHDLGIWTAKTFNYLNPSIKLAEEYLIKIKKESLIPEITSMISNHHKISKYKNSEYKLVEIFRKADWIDVLMGTYSFGLSIKIKNNILSTFPNAGFHKRIIQLTWKEFKKHPFNPLPMLKW